MNDEECEAFQVTGYELRVAWKVESGKSDEFINDVGITAQSREKKLSFSKTIREWVTNTRIDDSHSPKVREKIRGRLPN